MQNYSYLMRSYITRILGIVFLALVIASCANRGTPSGGEKDTEPPVILKSVPENFTTNFKGNEIRIYFDEYIKVKDVQRQLIISPPMDTQPDIIPLSSASKYIKITIKDTLQPNTTYAFNFGESIVDNNEENPYPYYRYVFSTGDYIDSLSVKGVVMDSKLKKPDTFVSVMLYEVDSTFTDSIIYKEKPKYITNTLDSVTTFSIDNLKAGKYLMVAVKDENSNYTFEPKSDKIGFHKDFIEVPSDSIYTLKLFEEELDFKAIKPKQITKQRIAFGYEGDYNGMQIEILNDSIPNNFKTKITKDSKTDTLYYWYKPKLELDSTLFVVKNKTYIDTLKHRFRDLDKDSLTVRALVSGTIDFSKDFSLQGSTPFVSLNEKQVTILDQDSVNVDFTTEFNKMENTYAFKFEKSQNNTYKIQMLPETFTDFFGEVNDTLNFNLKTKAYSDYSNVRVTLRNAKYPAVVQLTDDKGEVKYEQFATELKPIDFRYILPGTYFLRVVHDANGNQKWDTGNYLKKIQPERVSHFPDAIDARANWDPIIEFILE